MMADHSGLEPGYNAVNTPINPSTRLSAEVRIGICQPKEPEHTLSDPTAAIE